MPIIQSLMIMILWLLVMDSKLNINYILYSIIYIYKFNVLFRPLGSGTKALGPGAGGPVAPRVVPPVRAAPAKPAAPPAVVRPSTTSKFISKLNR